MKKLFPSYAVIITFALLMAGCGGNTAFRKSVAEEQSLVFGYIDMSDAPGSLFGATMKRVKPVTDKPYYGFGIDGGMFFRTEVPPGSYKFTSFSNFKSFGNTQYMFNLPSQGRSEMDPIIDKTGIYYVGSYKYKKVKTGFFEQGKFDIEKINKPTERELLTQLLERAKHPTWQAAIKKRINELK
ncbi:MAG TPA: hypothetical protein VK138_08285 [Acidiferrobacterales bacterium]|nr:hypothetical protein [Acidiferrobacterales bacterium]